MTAAARSRRRRTPAHGVRRRASASTASTPCAASPSSGWRRSISRSTSTTSASSTRTSTRDPVWTVQRACIVTLFLLCAGAGQAIASAQQQTLARFWRRWAQVAGCAVLVSLGSWLMFPRSFISFGVLHGIAVMLVVARFTASWGAWRWPLGLVAIALPRLVRDPFFDTPLDQLGRPRHAPAGDRGLRAGAALARRRLVGRGGGRLAARASAARCSPAPLPRAARPLAVLGRWSLTLLHGPPAGADRPALAGRYHRPMTRQLLFGFHAVGVRLKTAPRSVIEVHVDSGRRDPRMRQFVAARRGRRRQAGRERRRAPARLAGNARHQGVVARVEPIARSHSLDDTLDAVDAPASRRCCWCSTA